jgi:hypothetical protein
VFRCERPPATSQGERSLNERQPVEARACAGIESRGHDS